MIQQLKNIFDALVFIVAVLWSAKFNPDIADADLQQTFHFFASDSLKGRNAGELDDTLRTVFIREKFENADFQLLFENGFQKFELVAHLKQLNLFL